MITGFNHSSFTVSDLKRSIDFYCDILGMNLVREAQRPEDYTEAVTGIKDCSLKIAIVEGWGHRLELIEYVGPANTNKSAPCNSPGAGHICFNVNEIESTVERLRQKGVMFVSAPVTVPSEPSKGGKVVYGKDPDGIVFELVELPEKKERG